MDCLFCKIIAKEIPSTPVYEDEDVYAFLDIHPINPGHTLVVPKKHCQGFLDCDSSVVTKWIAATQKIAQAMKKGLALEGLNLEQNEGEVAGQVIRHLHIHIIPRYANDKLKHWPGKAYGSTEEMREIAEKILNGF
ncbi:MAG: HIT family protein [Candidatus Uhrbacteria bacterium]|nr:HIT family protein [Candidatus Uhrbacteria bacterium]